MHHFIFLQFGGVAYNIVSAYFQYINGGLINMEASLNVSVNSGDKIYVAVAHDYDGDTATGRVSVRHG